VELKNPKAHLTNFAQLFQL